jgi:hypothetical protein
LWRWIKGTNFRCRFANIWHVERFPWHAAFTAVPVFLFRFPNQHLYSVKNVYIYIHISICVVIVYELPLLPNNTANETFLHKLGAVRSVDWIFITGAPT